MEGAERKAEAAPSKRKKTTGGEGGEQTVPLVNQGVKTQIVHKGASRPFGLRKMERTKAEQTWA